MREYATINNIKVGDHITMLVGTDAYSYTVLGFNKRFVTIQKDYQEIDIKNWKPEIIPGGFCGHCTNNYSQKWIVESNPNGVIDKFSVSGDGFVRSIGSRRNNIILGAFPFRDYNF